ncbi:MAG: indole-3-glycerol-phosphate synthase [Euryarchaeota archaeon]|nr:indole-3-glycerol-phosphate synthase [Euryarchaeota archaeon]
MFAEILADCRSRFRGFKKEVKPERKPRSFEEAILSARRRGVNPVIAEVKFASPRGEIREPGDVEKIALAMQRGGACAISVLTEERYFKGSLDYLRRVSEVSSIPVLRKDFIFAGEQVDEAYYYGADSVLLISSFFSEEDLDALIARCRYFGMEPLVEVHSPQDVNLAERCGARIYVINNRDKDTLEIDLSRSERLAKLIDGIKISASGISGEEDLRRVLRHCDAALVGTSIMRSRNVEEATRRLVHA